MRSIDEIKATVKNCMYIGLNTGLTVDDLKMFVRELEQEAKPHRKNGRPLGVGNKQSQLMVHHARIKKELDDRIFRGDIAEGLGVSRQTLNEFIKSYLPEYHKAK